MGRVLIAGVMAACVVSASTRGEDGDERLPIPAVPVPHGPAGGPAPVWAPTRPDGPAWAPAARLAAPPPVVEVRQSPPPPAKREPDRLPAPQPVPPGGRDGTKRPPPAAVPPAPSPRHPVTPPPAQAVPPPVFLPADPGADSGPVLEPPPGKPAAAVPVRHKTFGSPNLTLSREYHLADLFGVDVPAGDVEVGEAAGDGGPPADRSYVRVEYLLWWVRAANIPALATTTTNGGFGFLGQPGTRTLLGPGTFGETLGSGFRIRAGTWFDHLPGLGLDGGFFFLGRRSAVREFDSAQFPTIARPFFAPNFAGEFGQLVAAPGLSTGTLRAETDSTLWGADVNLRCCLTSCCDRRAELFAGYRHLNLRESLTITETITAAGPLSPEPVGSRIVVRDDFRTSNQFHGGQVGWAGGRRFGRWEVDGRASVALGVTRQQLDVAGSQVVQRPGGVPPEAFRGGLLATGPNLGRFTRDRFAVAPEATVNVGYFLTPALRAHVGYNFLYWSNVIRPGDQIDRVVDVTRVPNFPTGAAVPVANRPLPTFRQADLWAQGLQFGLELRW